jgi:hypothetical protein
MNLKIEITGSYPQFPKILPIKTPNLKLSPTIQLEQHLTIQGY